MSKLSVRVTSRSTSDGQSYFEGTVTIPGLKAAKLVKQDGCTQYSTASAVRSAAERVATRLGMTTEYETPAPAKAAAKKSARTSGSTGAPNVG
jgi:hypothetical protein